MGQLDGLVQMKRWPMSGGATCLLELERPGHDADPDENLESRSETHETGSASEKKPSATLHASPNYYYLCGIGSECTTDTTGTRKSDSRRPGRAPRRSHLHAMEDAKKAGKRCWASRLALDKDRRATGTHGGLAHFHTGCTGTQTERPPTVRDGALEGCSRKTGILFTSLPCMCGSLSRRRLPSPTFQEGGRGDSLWCSRRRRHSSGRRWLPKRHDEGVPQVLQPPAGRVPRCPNSYDARCARTAPTRSSIAHPGMCSRVPAHG